MHNHIVINIMCPPLYTDFERMYQFIKYINELGLPYKLRSIVEDPVADTSSTVKDNHSLFLMAKNELLGKSLLILNSEMINGAAMELSHDYRVSDFEWPKREYSALILTIPYTKEANDKLLFDMVGNLANLFSAFKINVWHPKSNFYALSQRKYCIECNFIPPYGLPELPHLHRLKIDEYKFPSEITWMGYWSHNILQYLDLTPKTASDFFYKTAETKNGGMIYQLSKEHLHTDHSDHMKRLKNGYLNIPKVGGRNLLNHV